VAEYREPDRTDTTSADGRDEAQSSEQPSDADCLDANGTASALAAGLAAAGDDETGAGD